MLYLDFTMLKKTLLTFSLISLMILSGQVKTIKFSGHITSEDKSFPFKGLRYAEVKVFNSMDVVLIVTKTNDTGYFETSIIVPVTDTILNVEVSARSGQPVIALDSSCPYFVTRTPTGYFDQYFSIPVKDTTSRLSGSYKLKAPLICMFGGNVIYFEKHSTKFRDTSFPHPDTVLLCMANILKKPNGRKRKIILSGYAAPDEKRKNLAWKRAMKVKDLLIKHYGMTETDIEVSGEVVIAARKGPAPQVTYGPDNYIVSIMIVLLS
jgi:hypothetical protein